MLFEAPCPFWIPVLPGLFPNPMIPNPAITPSFLLPPPLLPLVLY